MSSPEDGKLPPIPASADPDHVGTTGHEWDGIRELNNPLPRWWLVILYATIAFSLLWVILYPALPGIKGNTPGILGYSARAEVHKEIAAVEARRAQALAGLDDMALTELSAHPQLQRAAVEGGRAAFKLHCSQCHGSGAAGSPGYPNLNDDDWLWGGGIDDIYTTIRHGIREPDNDDTRLSLMPSYGRDGILSPQEVDDVVEHVLLISGQQADAAKAARGSVTFEEQCSICHGPDGKGLREFGAPNLTDPIWLFGGDRESIHYTVWNARHGVMPAWGSRLDDRTIRQLAAYVHGLGGGE